MKSRLLLSLVATVTLLSGQNSVIGQEYYSPIYDYETSGHYEDAYFTYEDAGTIVYSDESYYPSNDVVFSVDAVPATQPINQTHAVTTTPRMELGGTPEHATQKVAVTEQPHYAKEKTNYIPGKIEAVTPVTAAAPAASTHIQASTPAHYQAAAPVQMAPAQFQPFQQQQQFYPQFQAQLGSCGPGG